MPAAGTRSALTTITARRGGAGVLPRPPFRVSIRFSLSPRRVRVGLPPRRRSLFDPRATSRRAVALAATQCSALHCPGLCCARKETRVGGHGLLFYAWSGTEPGAARLLLLCLLLRSSWLTVEGDRRVGAARVPHRQGGRAAVAVSVGVAGGVPERVCRPRRHPLLLLARAGVIAPAPACSPKGQLSSRGSFPGRGPLFRETRSENGARPVYGSLTGHFSGRALRDTRGASCHRERPIRE